MVIRAPARNKHTLPELPYDYSALEPVISRDIMTLHHSKHHATYVANLNAAEEKLKQAIEKGDVDAAIALGPAIRFNGGGHINHSIFWQNLTDKTTQPSSSLSSAIDASYGGLDGLKKELSAVSIAVQGSGWGWLGYNAKTQKLQIVAQANQDPLHATTGLIPLLGIDVWEHAYYLQYKNARASYVEAIFNVVNWEDVSKRFEAVAAKGKC